MFLTIFWSCIYVVCNVDGIVPYCNIRTLLHKERTETALQTSEKDNKNYIRNRRRRRRLKTERGLKYSLLSFILFYCKGGAFYGKVRG